jgi:hypothetical protein
VIEVGLDDTVPRSGDVYVIGGGEDSGQVLAGRSLMKDKLAADVIGAHTCLAVCAGFQLLSRTFQDGAGRSHEGLGLLDVECGRLEQRAVGEVVTEAVDLPGMPPLTGYENHGGTARLGGAARPLGTLVAGVGNGYRGAEGEGTQQGHVIATYLHGPVLVRNPALADLLLSRAAGPLPAYDDTDVDRLRDERLDDADPRRHRLRRIFPL